MLKNREKKTTALDKKNFFLNLLKIGYSTKKLNRIKKNKYLIDKFSGVDFMLGHSLYMSNKLKCVPDEMINIKNYLNLIIEREAFQKAINT